MGSGFPSWFSSLKNRIYPFHINAFNIFYSFLFILKIYYLITSFLIFFSNQLKIFVDEAVFSCWCDFCLCLPRFLLVLARLFTCFRSKVCYINSFSVFIYRFLLLFTCHFTFSYSRFLGLLLNCFD